MKVWIVDETSMMGTAQAAKLLSLAERESARFVLVGDWKQLPAIEAGKPFRMLMDRGMKVATIDEILRQKDPDLLEAVRLTVDGRDVEAVSKLDRSIVEVPDRDERLEAVAKAFMERVDEGSTRPLIVTGTNRDRADLNELIRNRLRASGKLVGEEVSGKILVSRSLTRAEIRDVRTYRKGDVIRFGREYKKFGIGKGEYLSVQRVDEKSGNVVLHHKDGRTVDWQPYLHARVEAYKAEERGIQKGDLVRWTRNDRDRKRRNGNLARVVEVDPDSRTATLEFEKGKKTIRQKLHLDSEPHWEHGYASTVHAAQGKTACEVIVHLDTSQKAVVGRESWYVAISRV